MPRWGASIQPSPRLKDFFIIARSEATRLGNLPFLLIVPVSRPCTRCDRRSPADIGYRGRKSVLVQNLTQMFIERQIATASLAMTV